MSQVVFSYSVSEKFLADEVIRTGTRGPVKRSLSVDMTEELSPAQRKTLMDAVEIKSNPLYRSHTVPLANWSVDNLIVTLTHSPNGNARLEYGSYEPVFFDAELDPETAVNATAENIKNVRDAIIFTANDNEHRQVFYDECVALFAENPHAAYDKAKEYGIQSWKPGGRDSIDSMLTIHRNEVARQKSKEYAKAEAEAKIRAEKEKSEWIAANGSAHLREAFNRGYDSQRQYVIERAAQEAPGWQVDFNGSADWRDRSFPSEKALKVEDEGNWLAGKLNARCIGVVWLTNEPSVHHDDYGYDYPFDPCEAVVIRDYLGLDKYDLVRIL